VWTPAARAPGRSRTRPGSAGDKGSTITVPPIQTATDAALIERSRRAPETFAALYDRHAAEIYRFAARRLSEHAAEDIVADTFLAAFRRRGQYDLRRTDARPWLYGIAVNLIGKHRRSEVRMWRALARAPTDLRTDGDAGVVDDRLAASERGPELAAAIAELAPADRHVLLLVAWAGFSYEEVAVALRVPVGTVRSRLSRARRKVRESLGPDDPVSPEQELEHERT
jgi:RNA polymerase sigma factor (sigma-70 family)